jgi:hypothetical protein
MRIRINIDHEISPRAKRVLKLAVPVCILLVGGVALAGVPHTFADGDALSAQAMNDIFSNLDTRLSKLEALVGTGTDGGTAVTGAVVWKDTTGAVMPVVRVLGDPSSGSQANSFEILDPASQAIFWWFLTSPAQGPYAAVNGGIGGGAVQKIWTTNNCTGTPYVQPFLTGYAFQVVGETSWYVVPGNVPNVQGAYASSGSGPGSCTGTGGAAYFVPLSSLTTITAPTAPPGVPPYHPEIVP